MLPFAIFEVLIVLTTTTTTTKTTTIIWIVEGDERSPL
jgi:hypothetical protein